MRRALGGALLMAVLLAACGETEMTPVPPGFPLNPCPMAGPQSVVPRAGYVLIPPGAIGFGYDAWHNETPDTFICGAQSVRGVKRVISRGALPSGILPWAATYLRAVPLSVAESQLPVSRLVRLDASGEVLVQSGTVEATPQFGTLGNAFDGISPIPLGSYRLDIIAPTGEVIATGQFQVVD